MKRERKRRRHLSKTDTCHNYYTEVKMLHTCMYYLCHGVDFSSLQLAIHLGKSFHEPRVAMTTCVLIQQWLLCCLYQSINQE